ncbi:MAG TPA: sulfatase-like hydrolase/transferase, partial [Tichowtungia sp.]|nr:sulfatase-like hydrolase/transferase [Tichowtungia sp.]
MTKRLPICFILLLTICTAAAAPLPNVVIVYADDMGFGDLKANNPNSKIPTPNLDRLAVEGMRFTDGHSSSGICTPSRFAMLTGQHHWRRFHGIVSAFGPSKFEPNDFTLAKMFKSKGYNTACVGKWHLGWDWDALLKPGVEQETYKDHRGRTKTVYKPSDYDWTLPIPDGPLAQGFDYYFGDGTINF